MSPDPGAILAFSGHRIDAPDRPEPRFPPEQEPAVAAAIAEALDELRPAIGYAAAASGGDILFLEALQERGAETRIVLPLGLYDFRQASVGDLWAERYHRVIERASVSFVDSLWGPEDGRTYAYGNLVFDGRARLRAQREGRSYAALALWNGQSVFLGSAGWMVQHWRRCGIDPRIIPLGSAPERVLEHEELSLCPALMSGPEAAALRAALAPWPQGL